MAESVGKIGLDLVVNQQNFTRQMQGITSIAKKAGAALAAAFAIKKLVDFGKSALDLGSNLAEVQNVVDVAFPNMTKQIDGFAKNAIKQFGLSETMAKQYAGTFGAMSQSFGFSEKAAAKMSTTLTALAGDVASFYNIQQSEAYTKLKSVFTGETESLKDLGVVMTQTALDAYAVANGYGKTTKKMSEAEKVALRYAFVQKQLAFAQGDFARTSNSWANQTRILSLQFDSLKASIGQGLINAFTPAIQRINVFMEKMKAAADMFKSFMETIFGDAGGGTPANNINKDMSSASGSAEDMEKATDKTAKNAKKIEKSVMGFDKLNTNAKSSKDKDTTSSAAPKIESSSIATPEIKIKDKGLKEFKKIIEKIKKALQPTIEAIERLKEALKPLKDFAFQALLDFYTNFLKPIGKWVMGDGLPRFIDAITNGLKTIDWKKINDALLKLWDALAPFAINVGEGLLWLWENVLVPLGAWTTTNIVPLFLEGLAAAIGVLNSLTEAFKPMAKWIFANFLEPLAEWTGGIIVSVLKQIVKTLNKFSAWASKNKGAVQGITVVVTGFFAAWKTVELMAFIQKSGGVLKTLQLLKNALFGVTAAKIKDKLETMYINALYAKDFIVSLANGTKGLIIQAGQFIKTTALKIADQVATIAMTVATTAWNVVCGIAATVTTALGAAIAFLTSPIGLVILAIGALIAVGVLLYKNWDKVKAFASQIWGKTKEIFRKVIDSIKGFFKKFNEFLANIFKKDFTSNFGILGNVMNAFKTNVQNIWNAVKKIFSGITKFVSGVFSGDWKKAWGGVKEIFGGIFDGLVALAKAPLNLVIGLINGMLDGISKGLNLIIGTVNKLSFDVPDWVPEIGGKTFGFNLKPVDFGKNKIPLLAQGGYVKANTPQLAVIGDNKHYGEVVAPEDKLYEITSKAVANALKAVSIGASKPSNSTEKLYLTVNVGAKTVAKEVALELSRENRRMGKAVYNLT